MAMNGLNFGNGNFSIKKTITNGIDKVTNVFNKVKEKVDDSIDKVNSTMKGLVPECVTNTFEKTKAIITDKVCSVLEAFKSTKIGSYFFGKDEEENNDIESNFKGFDIVTEVFSEVITNFIEFFSSEGFKTLKNDDVVEEVTVDEDKESSNEIEMDDSSLESETVVETVEPVKVVDIPNNFNQEGICPDHTQNYDTRGWESGTGQRRVRDAYIAAGSESDGILCTLDGRYLVAVADGKFGNVGDNIDVTLEDGTVIQCTIADVKGYDRLKSGNEWGHNMSKKGQSISLVEWEINTALNGDQNDFVNLLTENGWYDKEVVSISNMGPSGY